MDIGNLKDSLIDMAKDKAREAAEGVLEQHEDAGGIAGTAAGFGREALDSVLGGREEEGGEEQAEESRSEASDDSGDETSSEDSPDDDNDDNN